MTFMLNTLALYMALNLGTFLLFWWDKRAARMGQRRIRERTLLSLAFLGGSLGAVTAQRMLRHKTLKQPFCSILRAIVIVHVGLLLSLAVMTSIVSR